MLNLTLLKKEIKSNYKILLIFLALVTLYSSVIVVMFDPELGKALNEMAESMGDIFAAFGMANVGSTLIEFIANYLYGFILIAVPSVAIVIIANRLVARYVDNGSMAYLLASPHSRREIITTQAIALSLTVFTIVAYATGVIIFVSAMSFPGDLDIEKLIQLNLGLFGLLLLLSSICFFGSTLFNDTRKANGLGGGIIIIAILLQMISPVGDKIEFLKYFTPLTLLDVNGIIAGNQTSLMLISILFVLAIIIYAVSIQIFTKKDLSI